MGGDGHRTFGWEGGNECSEERGGGFEGFWILYERRLCDFFYSMVGEGSTNNRGRRRDEVS